MIFPEVKLRKLLANNHELISLMNSMRSTDVHGDPMVFTGKITDKYTAYNYSPMIRINYLGSSWRGADNDYDFQIPRILVSFWCKTLAEGQQLYPLVRKILKDNGYLAYDDSHDKDPDSQDSKGKQLYMFRLFVRNINMEEEDK